MSESTPFKLHCELDVFEKADDPDGHTMRIGGVVTTDQLDKQGEKLIQSGLDFTPFLKEGWFNDNHGQKTTDVLGYPTDARFVKKGARLPNGKTAETNGWWAEGFLLDTERGRETFNLCRSLHKSPRKLGFSIEGKVGRRARHDPTTILTATVKNVAVTHCPVNVGTEMHALAKALTAGSAIANPGSAPGEGFALRQESGDGRAYGRPTDDDDSESVVDTSKTENLGDGDGDDADNGGWAGLNPHATPVRNPKDALPPSKREIVKAEVERDFRIVDELDLIEEWAPILRAQAAQDRPPDLLTKAEARIIVGHRFPHLTDDQIDQILVSAQT